MQINRSLLNWGVFLIALGGVPLAVDQGWVASDIASELGQLWPLILVGIGLGLILRWTPLSWFGGALVAATFGVIFGAAAVSLRDNDLTNVQGIIPAIVGGACAEGDTPAESTTSEGIASSEEFTLDVSLPCGELTLERASDPTWRVVAAHDPGEPPIVEQSDGSDGTTDLSIRDRGSEEIVFIGRQTRSEWDVEVPAEATLTLRATLDAARGAIDTGSGPVDRVDVTLNASEATIDLGGGVGADVDPVVNATLNASDGHLVLPPGSTQVDITLNASSLEICAAEAMPMELELNETLSSSDLGDSGLEDAGNGTWETPGFTRSGGYHSLQITSTVSSLTIERPESCA